MKKLLKAYNLRSREQYFDICIESYINGQKEQAKEQYKAMPKANKKMMIMYLLCDYEENKPFFNFFFNIL